jgi:hypothetical protein
VGIVVLFSGVLVAQLSKKKRKPSSGHVLLPRRRTSRYLGWSTHSSWIDMVVIMDPVGRAKAVIPMRGDTIFVHLVSLFPFLGVFFFFFFFFFFFPNWRWMCFVC